MDFSRVYKDWKAAGYTEQALYDLLVTPQRIIQFRDWVKAGQTALGLGSAKIPEDPASFAEKFSALHGGSEGGGQRWVRARHLEKINEVLLDIASGKKRFVIIAMPPRHGKTETATFWNPLWRLARKPSTRIALLGYSAEFIANRVGRPLRNYIRDYGKEFGLELDPSSTAAHSWKVTGGGYVHTAGRGGSLSGLGFDLICIDDPYKNFEEANSETIREEAWNWWTSTVWSRKEPTTSFLIIQTLWHVDDLASRLIRMGESGEGPKWEVLRLPAIAEDADPLGREPGEALWPERIPVEELLLTKKGSPAFQWSALYQQNPIPAEGGMFQFSWWQYWEVLPEKFDLMIQSWDFSFKDAKKSDFVVGQVWGRLGARFYLVDQIRERMSAKDSIEAIRLFTAKYPQARAKLFEDKANGPALKSLLHNEVGGILPVQPRGNKEARASAISPFVQAGNVYIPSPKVCPWVNDYILEFGAFPNGAKDDQVDATSQALNYLAPGGYAAMGALYNAASREDQHHSQSLLQRSESRVHKAIQKAVQEQRKRDSGPKFRGRIRY